MPEFCRCSNGKYVVEYKIRRKIERDWWVGGDVLQPKGRFSLKCSATEETRKYTWVPPATGDFWSRQPTRKEVPGQIPSRTVDATSLVSSPSAPSHVSFRLAQVRMSNALKDFGVFLDSHIRQLDSRLAMADQGASAKPAPNATEVRESIEAKPSANVEDKTTKIPQEITQEGPTEPDATADDDADANEDADADLDADADAEADADADADEDEEADGDDDAEGDEDADGDLNEDGQMSGLSSDMFTVIENTANYLSSYRDENGYHVAQPFQRIPNRRLIPDYYDVIKEAIAFSTIRVRLSFLPPPTKTYY